MNEKFLVRDGTILAAGEFVELKEGEVPGKKNSSFQNYW